MKASDIDEGVGVLVDTIACIPSVDRILLFGSRARGDNFNDRVDVDLAVEGQEISKHQWNMIHLMVEAAPTLLRIDCVHLNKQDGEFLENILKDGITLYERGKS